MRIDEINENMSGLMQEGSGSPNHASKITNPDLEIKNRTQRKKSKNEQSYILVVDRLFFWLGGLLVDQSLSGLRSRRLLDRCREFSLRYDEHGTASGGERCEQHVAH